MSAVMSIGATASGIRIEPVRMPSATSVLACALARARRVGEVLPGEHDLDVGAEFRVRAGGR